jgi:hypothetical protein
MNGFDIVKQLCDNYAFAAEGTEPSTNEKILTYERKNNMNLYPKNSHVLGGKNGGN